MDGRQQYDSKEVPKFNGLLTSIEPTKDDFPDTASPFMKNWLNVSGVLESRTGRRRLNDTAYANTITSLCSYTDRNNVNHFIFSVQSAAEGNETPDGTLKTEDNAGTRHNLINQWTIGNSYCYDLKVRNDSVYVMLFNSGTSNATSIKKYSKDGELEATHTISSGNYRNCFEIDDLGNLYIFKDVSGNGDLVEKFTFGGASQGTYVLSSGTGATATAMLIHEGFLYVGYNDGTNAKVDKITLALALSSNIYSVVSSDTITSVAYTSIDTPFITRRNAAGTTRSLYYYNGVSWTQITGEFVSLPARIVADVDRVYLSFVDDTVTGASQAMFYIYTSNIEYVERLGTAFLSAASKNKPWDITTQVAAETSTIESGRLVFDVDSDHIYFLDAVADSASSIGLFTTVKKFRR